MNNMQPLSHKILQQDGTNQLFPKEHRKKNLEETNLQRTQILNSKSATSEVGSTVHHIIKEYKF